MKKLYIIACVLLVLAIGLRIVALNAASDGAHSLAMATANRQPADDHGAHDARISDSLTLASAVLAFLGIAFWVYSFTRGYRWKPVIPVILLIVYVAFFLVFV